MTLSVCPIQYNVRANSVRFCAKDNESSQKVSANQYPENPITRKGETLNLIKATFLAGLALGCRLLFELMDGDFLFQHAGKKASDIVDKNHNKLKGATRDIYKVGAAIGLLAAGVSLFAILYTVLNAPKIAYNGKVNAFKKSKEMDAYIAANKVEQNIYTELNEKGKVANTAEREKLKEQYMQMRIAKNQVPDFVYEK